MKIDTKKLRQHLEGALACLDNYESGDSEQEEASAAPESDGGDDSDMMAKRMKMKLSKYKGA